MLNKHAHKYALNMCPSLHERVFEIYREDMEYGTQTHVYNNLVLQGEGVNRGREGLRPLQQLLANKYVPPDAAVTTPNTLTDNLEADDSAPGKLFCA